MTGLRTYLDHNATSPLRPEARQAMLAVLDNPSNASSVHAEGRSARAFLETARDQLAAALGCKRDMITFTSGGTEANNLAIKGSSADSLVLSAIEHPCVAEAAKATGKPVTTVPVDGNGIVDLEALDQAVAEAEGTSLVSVMLANNETGAIQPVADVAEIAARHGALVHCDAVQAVGKIPVRWPLLGIDMLTVTGHKFGGPQGAGALVVREGLEIAATIHGGGQELRRRPGTENVAAIAGLGAAVAVASRLDTDIKQLRDRLESALQAKAPGLTVFAAGTERLPNTCCFAIEGMAADTTLIAADLEGIAVSSGSACSSGKVAASPVLAAMGVSPDLAQCAIRVSLGWTTTQDDVDRFIDVWHRLIERHQARPAA
ncbi:MAG: cysteine desulfurase [Hyphomicrobiales bacterium]|nr:cysteine desulfurase [Hyphomicrobiales bacterium]